MPAAARERGGPPGGEAAPEGGDPGNPGEMGPGLRPGREATRAKWGQGRDPGGRQPGRNGARAQGPGREAARAAGGPGGKASLARVEGCPLAGGRRPWREATREGGGH